LAWSLVTRFTAPGHLAVIQSVPIGPPPSTNRQRPGSHSDQACDGDRAVAVIRAGNTTTIFLAAPSPRFGQFTPTSPDFAGSEKPLLRPNGPLDRPADRLVPDGPSVASPGRDGPPDLAHGDPAHAGPDGPLAGLHAVFEHCDGAAQLELVAERCDQVIAQRRDEAAGSRSTPRPWPGTSGIDHPRRHRLDDLVRGPSTRFRTILARISRAAS
jgi:hypothetical protein